MPSPQKEYKPTSLSFMIGCPGAPAIGWPDYIADHLRWDLKQMFLSLAEDIVAGAELSTVRKTGTRAVAKLKINGAY